MNPNKRYLIAGLALCALLFLLSFGYSVEKKGDPFLIVPHDGGCHFSYTDASGQKICPSQGIDGYNVAPRLHRANGQAWIIWEIVRNQRSAIGIYNLNLKQAGSYSFTTMKDIGQIEALLDAQGQLQGVFFIGKDRQIDLFYYDWQGCQLTRLTNSRDIEHTFAFQPSDNQVQFNIEMIKTIIPLTFDRQTGRSSQGEPRARTQKISSPEKKTTASRTELDDYFVAFGDSITAGKMYLPQEGDTMGQYRPHYAYASQLETLLSEEGYDVAQYNAGVGGEITAWGRDRIDSILDMGSFTTLLLMHGSNDMLINTIIPEASIENISSMIDAARSRHMRVLLCTIPPSNDQYIGFTYSKTLVYNDLVRRLARSEKVELIEVYNTFMDYPDGYEVLLEERNDLISSGVHPNRLGHAMIAAQMKENYDSYLLKPPQAITSSNPTDLNGKKVSWQAPNSKFIDYYVLEFGLAPNSFTQSINMTQLSLNFTYLYRFFSPSPTATIFEIIQKTGQAPTVIFHRAATVYFRLKTVNSKGLHSNYSPTYQFSIGNN